jgi:hypothetical protein
MATRTLPQPTLSAAIIRRRRPLLLPPPSAYAPRIATTPASDWSADLRFFATCYAAGVLFFLIMLS